MPLRRNNDTPLFSSLENTVWIVVYAWPSFFTKSGINDLKIKFLPKENKILISSLNNQIGENEAELKVEISGINNEVSFNYQYLLDGLLNLPGEEFSLEIIDNNLPGVIKSTSDNSFLYLIMPIRMNE